MPLRFEVVNVFGDCVGTTNNNLSVAESGQPTVISGVSHGSQSSTVAMVHPVNVTLFASHHNSSDGRQLFA